MKINSVHIDFETINAAFDDNQIEEITAVLTNLIKRIEAGEIIDSIKDSNGNGIGVFQLCGGTE